MNTFAKQAYNTNRFNRDLMVIGIKPLVFPSYVGSLDVQLTFMGFLLISYHIEGATMHFGIKLDPTEAAKMAILGNAEWLAGNAEICPFESSVPLAQTIEDLHTRALKEISELGGQEELGLGAPDAFPVPEYAKDFTAQAQDQKLEDKMIELSDWAENVSFAQDCIEREEKEHAEFMASA